MGQDQSQPSLRLQRNERKRNSKQRSVEKPKELATLKNILIIANTQEITIEVTDDTLTCGWLLSETIRAYTGTGTIVALKTAKKLEILDYWLNIFDRSLQPLKDNEKLIAVFDQPVSSDVQINHFIPLKVIGEGGFSKVVMAAKKDTGLLYAIKVMSKEFVIKEEKISQIITEKNILTKCFHPFIVELHWAFQSARDLYLVMDFCPGGELFFHLHNLGRITEEQAKFYFSEILLGMEYLHNLNIVYRDLKPENVLLDIDGHVRITDFGLSKEEINKAGKSYSFCGSPEYMSPEMLKGLGHGREVDYYSIGALLYEMLTGNSPFYDPNRSKMYMKILNDELQYPTYLSRHANNLISKLLEKDPSKRLGSENGIEDIKAHPWLKSIDWKRIYQKKVPPPFRPDLTHSNFNPEYTMLPLHPDDFNVNSTPSAFPFEEFDYAHQVAINTDYKLKSVNLESISTTVSKIGFFSRNGSQSKISIGLDDDESTKTVEEEKRSKFLVTGTTLTRSINIDIPDLELSNFETPSIDIDTENSIFKQKTSAPKQKLYLVKRNNKKTGS